MTLTQKLSCMEAYLKRLCSENQVTEQEMKHENDAFRQRGSAGPGSNR